MRFFVALSMGCMGLAALMGCRKNNTPLFDGVSCTGDCYILAGQLKDTATNQGIANGEIRFFFRDITGTIFSKTYLLGKTTTNNTGNYTFRFSGSRFAKVRGYYYAEAYKDNFFADQLYPNRVSTFDLDSVHYNIPFVQNFLMFRPATLRVRVVAVNNTSYTYLNLGYGFGKTGGGFVFNGGRRIDTTITWKTAGDIRTFFQAEAVGNGATFRQRDTLVVPAGGTRQVEVRL